MRRRRRRRERTEEGRGKEKTVRLDISEVLGILVLRWSMSLGNTGINRARTRAEERVVFCLSPRAKLLSWREDTELMETQNPFTEFVLPGFELCPVM